MHWRTGQDSPRLPATEQEATQQEATAQKDTAQVSNRVMATWQEARLVRAVARRTRGEARRIRAAVRQCRADRDAGPGLPPGE